MEQYEVRMTPFAEKAVREIGRYIAVTLQSPQAATRTLSTIRKEIKALNIMPSRFPLVSEEPWRSESVHKMPVKNFLVYYWTDEEKKIVHIIHVVYGRRNQKTQMVEIPMN